MIAATRLRVSTDGRLAGLTAVRDGQTNAGGEGGQEEEETWDMRGVRGQQVILKGQWGH